MLTVAVIDLTWKELCRRARMRPVFGHCVRFNGAEELKKDRNIDKNGYQKARMNKRSQVSMRLGTHADLFTFRWDNGVKKPKNA